MRWLVVPAVLVLVLGCGPEDWERAIECKALVESAERCVEYKTLEEALVEVSDQTERRKITLLYKIAGPTPAPMCKARGLDSWGRGERRDFEACQEFLAQLPAEAVRAPESLK